jgi:hypothetical protein
VLSARTTSLQTHPHDVQGSIEAMETPVESFFQTQKTEHTKHIQNARSSASLTSRGNPSLYRVHNSIRYRSSQLDHKSLAWVPGYHTSRCNILITTFGTPQNDKSFVKYFHGVESWKDFCKRLMLLEGNWSNKRPVVRESVVQVGYDPVWRFKPDFKRRFIVSTSQSGGVCVTDMDDGRMLWRLRREDVRMCKLDPRYGRCSWILANCCIRCASRI